MNKQLQHICNTFNINEQEIINCYIFGSTVYQTTNIKSDIDYILVCNNLKYKDILQKDKSIDLGNNKINLKLYSHKIFVELIKQHRIDVLECLFLKDKFILKQTVDYKYHFKLNLDTLRRSISAVCSNSYVKCKKKLKQEDDYIGKKSMFHSLRIAHYGIQIAKYNEIVDYINLDDNYTTITLFNEIFKLNNWNEINNKYKHYANNLRTQFRLVAPLNK